jgi:hypothetical protein
MKIDGFFQALVFALVFSGIWGCRSGIESNSARHSIIGVVFVLLGFLVAVALYRL